MQFRPIRPIKDQPTPTMGLYMNWNLQNASPALGSFISMLDLGAPRRFADTIQNPVILDGSDPRELHR